MNFYSILALKIDPKINKGSIKMLMKTRCKKKCEKERNKSQDGQTYACKPDLAGERKAPFEAGGLI